MIPELRYAAWGEVRYNRGTTPTRYQYTGQYSYAAEFGLYFYNARWYDPALGRFAQPDTLIPEQSQGVQAWDRYAYVNNNPLRYNDPSGHCIFCLFIPFALSAVGITPDAYGIAITIALTDTDNAVVAAGLAVQSQHPWTIFTGGKGWAQAGDNEVKEGRIHIHRPMR